MEPQLEKIREVQREAWNKASTGWKKWDEMTMQFFRPQGEEIIRMLKLNARDQVLDVATGTGEPGLTIASMVPGGKVTGTDLSEEMLSAAKANAAGKGLKNFETVCCDIMELPFENNSFDAISCRLGFMFFPDMQIAMNEMVRVLKPGGRIAASVWNTADRNSWIHTSMSTMITRLELKPAPGGPGPFRCAEPGMMVKLFRNSGLKNIEEKEVNASLNCGNISTYWNFISEVSSPMAYSKADDTLKQSIKEEILAKVNQLCPDGNIALSSCAIVIGGEK